MADQISPRVNSAIMPRFVGKIVRLACKVLTMTESTVTVQAADGGEILVQFAGDSGITSKFVEIIGNVVDETTIKKVGIINLGGELDMHIVNRTIELIHDPRFFTTIFS